MSEAWRQQLSLEEELGVKSSEAELMELLPFFPWGIVVSLRLAAGEWFPLGSAAAELVVSRQGSRHSSPVETHPGS